MVFLGVHTSEGTEGVKLWQRHNRLVGSWLASDDIASMTILILMCKCRNHICICPNLQSKGRRLMTVSEVRAV